ncbi:hypothetical protein ACSBR1_016455 [Camellia fascicularis]
MNPKGLYVLFSKSGVVKDVFIPNKRRITQSRFDFVRYDCPIVAGVAVQKTNGIWCEDKVLKVKRAEYGNEQIGKDQLKVKIVPVKQSLEVSGRMNTVGRVNTAGNVRNGSYWRRARGLPKLRAAKARNSFAL